MITHPVRPSSAAIGPVTAGLQALFTNLSAMLQVLLRVREIHRNGLKMADLLREADRIEAESPARAQALRNAAHRLPLA